MAGGGEEMTGAEVQLCIIQWGLGHVASPPLYYT